MTELPRIAVAELAPLGSSDVFKTQAERRTELRRVRMVDTLLLVLMAVICLAMRRAPTDRVWAAYLSAFAEAGIGGAVLSDCQFLIRLSFPKTNVAQGRSWGLSSPTTFSPSAWPSYACHRSTLSVLRRDGSRTSATREQRSCLAGRKSGAISPRWSTIETLVSRRELQVGTDLQYIRINGTLVGGWSGS
jgi:hypothetical protein